MKSTTEHHQALPDDLTSPRSKLVYLALTDVEEATVTELQQQLNLSKLTLLAVLSSLIQSDHIQRTQQGYASY